jgi:hypothetical protein
MGYETPENIADTALQGMVDLANALGGKIHVGQDGISITGMTFTVDTTDIDNNIEAYEFRHFEKLNPIRKIIKYYLHL